jgi:predicted TIM-barrel fold metal-dependent hydrolase
MLLGPHDIARRLQYQHRPGWSIWYGAQTRQYWALARWARTPHCMFGADTPEQLQAAITTFETLHPSLAQRSHALAD